MLYHRTMSEIEIPKNIDVAITFLGQDESIAKDLYDSLSERLDVFYYAERQPELVGTDGEESFGEIFRDKARVVVVLYRKGWGETMMTRAERSGIKQRASKEGYNFSIWVPLDEEKSIPAFLDPQFIWFDFNRWGIDGLAAVIEEKVKESGVKVRPETVFDRLNKFNKKVELKKEIDSFHWSPEGVSFVQKAANNLESVIKNKTEKFEEITKEIRFGVQSSREQVSVTSFPFKMNFYVYQKASNTVHDSEIIVSLLKDNKKPGYYDSNFSKIKEYKFHPTLDEDRNPVWAKDNDGLYSLEELIDYMLTELTDYAIDDAENRLNH